MVVFSVPLLSGFQRRLCIYDKGGPMAEQMQHHPEWSNVYNRVSIRLTTHDAGNTVTELDRRMAALIDKLV